MNEARADARAYIQGLIDISVKLITRPLEFFRTMPKAGGFVEPLIYVVATTVLGVVLGAIESFVFRGAGLHDLRMFAVMLVITPLIAVILSVFISGIYFAIWSFIGSGENYETSYRCMAYMMILLPLSILLSAVPYLGLLGIAWWLVLMVIATREVHKVPVKPALLAFGVIAALSALIYYNSVSSEMKSRERLKEYTKELQRVPVPSGVGNAGKQ